MDGLDEMDARKMSQDTIHTSIQTLIHLEAT